MPSLTWKLIVELIETRLVCHFMKRNKKCLYFGSGSGLEIEYWNVSWRTFLFQTILSKNTILHFSILQLSCCWVHLQAPIQFWTQQKRFLGLIQDDLCQMSKDTNIEFLLLILAASKKLKWKRDWRTKCIEQNCIAFSILINNGCRRAFVQDPTEATMLPFYGLWMMDWWKCCSTIYEWVSIALLWIANFSKSFSR